MKVLVMYEYPPQPAGLATQGDLLYRGLLELGVEVFPVNLHSRVEKEWYFRWFKPDVAVGIGYWGHTPEIVFHPMDHGILPVPWLVADGFVANYREALNSLPLILVTSNWVRDVYNQDGVNNPNIKVLPVGCDVDKFSPRAAGDPRVAAIRKQAGVGEGEIVILTAGGDAASKGGQEVMQALARVGREIAPWRYVIKVWPQERTVRQNQMDMDLARSLGIMDRLIILDEVISRNFMPYLMQACDIYAAPARLEGFGMLQVEAGACGKPVIGLRAMGMLDTLIHGETALLARVAVENRIREATLGPESGFPPGTCISFDPPRIADYRACVDDICDYLVDLAGQPDLRERLGQAGRRRAEQLFDYRRVANDFVKIVQDQLGIA